jgi:hypothetical protein
MKIKKKIDVKIIIQNKKFCDFNCKYLTALKYPHWKCDLFEMIIDVDKYTEITKNKFHRCSDCVKIFGVGKDK